MNLSTLARRPLLVLAPLCLAAVAADEIRFAPKDGSEVKKKLNVQLEFNIDKLEVSANGESIPPEALGEITDKSVTLKLAQEVSEVYTAVKDGRPTDLLRTYEVFEVGMEAGEESQKKSIDDLVGKTVRFKWDADKSEYSTAFHDTKGDDAVLRTLSADMDLRVLLPEGKVADGAKWKVPGKSLMAVFFPGLRTADVDPAKLEGDAKEMYELIRDDLTAQMEKASADMELKCDYAGKRQDGARELAEVHVACDSKIEFDLSKVLQHVAEKQGGSVPEVHATIRLDVRGEGKALWDLKEQRIASFDLDADLGLTLSVKATGEEGGESVDFSVEGHASGKGTWKLEAKKP
jgi:hypothetical protein